MTRRRESLGGRAAGRDAGPGAAGGAAPRAELRASVAAGPRRRACAGANVGGQRGGQVGLQSQTWLSVRPPSVSSAAWLPLSCFPRLGKEGGPGKPASPECGRREGLFWVSAVREHGESRAGSPEPRVPGGRLWTSERGTGAPGGSGLATCLPWSQTFLLPFGWWEGGVSIYMWKTSLVRVWCCWTLPCRESASLLGEESLECSSGPISDCNTLPFSLKMRANANTVRKLGGSHKELSVQLRRYQRIIGFPTRC